MLHAIACQKGENIWAWEMRSQDRMLGHERWKKAHKGGDTCNVDGRSHWSICRPATERVGRKSSNFVAQVSSGSIEDRIPAKIWQPTRRRLRKKLFFIFIRTRGKYFSTQYSVAVRSIWRYFLIPCAGFGVARYTAQEVSPIWTSERGRLPTVRTAVLFRRHVGPQAQPPGLLACQPQPATKTELLCQNMAIDD
jgi:hypothetical protein